MLNYEFLIFQGSKDSREFVLCMEAYGRCLHVTCKIRKGYSYASLYLLAWTEEHDRKCCQDKSKATSSTSNQVMLILFCHVNAKILVIKFYHLSIPLLINTSHNNTYSLYNILLVIWIIIAIQILLVPKFNLHSIPFNKFPRLLTLLFAAGATAEHWALAERTVLHGMTLPWATRPRLVSALLRSVRTFWTRLFLPLVRLHSWHQPTHTTGTCWESLQLVQVRKRQNKLNFDVCGNPLYANEFFVRVHNK